MNGPIAILGPGTGLGVKTTKSPTFSFSHNFFQEALLFPGNDNNTYTIYPTEVKTFFILNNEFT